MVKAEITVRPQHLDTMLRLLREMDIAEYVLTEPLHDGNAGAFFDGVPLILTAKIEAVTTLPHIHRIQAAVEWVTQGRRTGDCSLTVTPMYDAIDIATGRRGRAALSLPIREAVGV